MTELLYHADSYLTTFEARVVAVDPDQQAVILDRTVFYPGGGGQPADSGQLVIDGSPHRVVKARKQGDDVLHVLEEGPLPAVGAACTGTIDWARRYQLMRTHTAMHILCGVVWRDYGASVTGGNMEPLKGRMDFEFERLRKEFVQEIEAKVNLEMAAGHPIRVQVLPREEAFAIPDLIRTKINLLPAGITEVRTVEIVGLDLQADGGTHVANTAEVGPIHIPRYTSKGGINKRLYVELDAQV
ncbi:MAG: alanyl-tRNA editing protein [Anaerolineae bacterium]|nr:alanyl-tRNA editing protein [Anaerolineae bacterium]